MHQMGLAHDSTPTVDEVLGLWAGKEKRDWMSRKDIASRLGRSKSPTLITIISVAVGLGLLEQKLVSLPNQVGMFMYRPTANAFQKLAVM